jgi:hypothetical protein
MDVRTFLMSIAVCMAVAASIWMSASHSAFSTPSENEPTASPSTANSVITTLPSSSVVAMAAAVRPAAITAGTPVLANLDAHSDSHDHDHDEVLDGAGIKFDSLPSEMQEEITQLSGRDEVNTVVNEVSPGVFLMSKGPRVVPVAVMNEDGTVTIHEY